jgi:hypothetical protein
MLASTGSSYTTNFQFLSAVGGGYTGGKTLLFYANLSPRDLTLMEFRLAPPNKIP